MSEVYCPYTEMLPRIPLWRNCVSLNFVQQEEHLRESLSRWFWKFREPSPRRYETCTTRRAITAAAKMKPR